MHAYDRFQRKRCILTVLRWFAGYDAWSKLVGGHWADQVDMILKVQYDESKKMDLNQ